MAGSGHFGILSTSNAGVDQGVDYAGAGAIPALDHGVVTDVSTSHIRQGYSIPVVVYRLTGGPHRGQYVYIAENFKPTVRVGDRLQRGDVVGEAVGAYPYIEMGFNRTARGWAAYGSPESPQPQGYAMARYVQSVISSGAPVGKPKRAPYGSGAVKDGEPGSPTGGGGGGVLGGIESAVGSAASGNPVGAGLSVIGDVGSHLPVIGGLFSGVKSASDAISFLFSERGLQTIGGGIIFLMGLYLLARQVGLAANVPGVVTAVAAPELAATERIQSAAGARLAPTAAAAGSAARRRSGAEPSRRSAGGRRTIRNVYYLDEPQAARTKRRAAASGPSEEIPF